MTSPSFFGLLRRRECLLPTWRGWLVLAGILALTAFAALKSAYPFLAVQQPASGGVLVVEGWAPDYVMADALNELRRGGYKEIFVTGVPLEAGDVLFEHRTYAELGAATLLKLGADPATVQAIPAPAVRQDRTYTSAVTLKVWLFEHGIPFQSVNVMTFGAHARRTRLLYEKAFGPSTQIGVVSVADRSFDPQHWWRSSQGFRIVTGEAIAYVYARLLFREKETPPVPAG